MSSWFKIHGVQSLLIRRNTSFTLFECNGPCLFVQVFVSVSLSFNLVCFILFFIFILLLGSVVMKEQFNSECSVIFCHVSFTSTFSIFAAGLWLG